MMLTRFRLLLSFAVLALSSLRAEDYSITTFAGAANVITGADGTNAGTVKLFIDDLPGLIPR